MECEGVREQFIERLTGTLDADRSAAIDRHLATCAACRAETERMQELWKELGTLRAPAATGAGRRIERLIDARARSVPSQSRARQIGIVALGLAASLAVGVLLGRTTGDHSARSIATQSASAKERYILLLHGPARDADSVGHQAIVAEYKAWAGKLQESGALVTAEELADDPVTMLAANTQTELPHDTPDEVGGFFLIQVADSAEAFRIAKECPHLKHGGTVQVRRIVPT